MFSSSHHRIIIVPAATTLLLFLLLVSSIINSGTSILIHASSIHDQIDAAVLTAQTTKIAEQQQEKNPLSEYDQHYPRRMRGVYRDVPYFNSNLVDPSDDRTIFVAIASFRDVECVITIDWMFFRASNPRRVFLGIIEQNEHDDPTCVPDKLYSCTSGDFCPLDNIRRRRVPSKSGRGPTYGRYISMLMYRGENYYMMIDSHNVWTKHWDRKSILQLQRARSSRPVISHYPNTWNKQGEQHEANGNVMCMCNGHYLKNLHFIRMDAAWIERRIEPYPQPFTAAGYVLADAQILKYVPFDPNLDYLFDGEEILFSVRSWTNGFDLFTPGESVLFHDYARHNAKRYWHTPNSRWGYEIVHAQKRVQYFLQVRKPNTTELLIDPKNADARTRKDEDKYGPGKFRSVREYEVFAQIDPVFEKADFRFCAILVNENDKQKKRLYII